MSKEYEEFFKTKVNIEDNYDMQLDEAAAMGWRCARDAIVELLNKRKFYSREEGVIIDADIINYIEKL